MSPLIRWTVALILLAAAFGACKRGGSDSGGSSAAPPPAPPAPPPLPITVDLDVDTNRNGAVQEPLDDSGEQTWTTTLGAVFYFNLDDDNNNNAEDHLDTTVNGTNDANDLARLLVRQMVTLPSTATLTVAVSAAAQGRIRVFRNDGGGSWSQAYSAGASFLVPAALAIAGDVEYGVEARDRISPSWDGRVTFVIEARDSGGSLLGTDTVQMRCAPFIMTTNLWPLEDLCVVTTAAPYANSAFRTVLFSTCSAAGVNYTEVPGASYSEDRWIQDSHETGALYLPVSGSPRRRVDHVMQCARWRPVDAWCEAGLFGPDFDFLERFSSNSSSHNYGGNIEVTGPLSGYPWGRILIGGGTSAPIGGGSPVTGRLVQVYRDYFDALDIQGPWLEISTEWLLVGHVDELVQVVPAPASQRGWAILIASPDLARANLQSVSNAGGGNLNVFAGRITGGWQTTVSAILGNNALMTYNDAVQDRIDSVRSVLQTQLGLSASDFISLPVLFEDAGQGYALAYNPGVVNLVVIPSTNGTTYMVIPDPEGPDQPSDVWQATTTAAIQSLFTSGSPVSIAYADVFYSYHDLAGEAHCGVNFVRTPPAMDWWDD